MRRIGPDLVFSNERTNLAFMRQIALRWQSTDGLEKISIAETTVMAVTWKEVFPALTKVSGNNGGPQTSLGPQPVFSNHLDPQQTTVNLSLHEPHTVLSVPLVV